MAEPALPPDRAAAPGRSWALLLLTLGGAAALLGATQPWARLRSEGALTVDEAVVTGAALAPLTTAAGLVGLAAVVAVLAVRSWLRVLVAVVVVLMAGLGLVQVVRVAIDLTEAARSWWRVEVAGIADSASADVTLWWAVSGAGLLLVLVGGVVVLVAGRRWSGLSSRYERPGATPATSLPAAKPREGDAWRALDRGEDPTAADEPPPAAGA